MTKMSNILGWCLLWWQLPLVKLYNILPFKIYYPISQIKIWFMYWHKTKKIIYTKKQRENIKWTIK
jgi:hypothetical protein